MHKSFLLVIDFINDIVNPAGKFSSAAAYVKEFEVIQHANKAIAQARANSIPILFVKLGFSAHYLECPEKSPLYQRVKESQALQLNTWGTAFAAELDVQSDDIMLIKHRVSAFHATGLENFLRANQAEKLFICGVSTDLTVQTTAREAHDRDYEVVIIEDACGAMTQEIHQNTIKSLARIATLTTADKLC